MDSTQVLCMLKNKRGIQITDPLVISEHANRSWGEAEADSREVQREMGIK